MVDVEATGPCPGLFSMWALGAIVVEPSLDRGFLGYLRPEGELDTSTDDPWSQQQIHDALTSVGARREELWDLPEPCQTMKEFYDWVVSLDCRPLFVSDNNGFDWQFVNYYLWKYLGKNPFGHSSTNLGSLYKGMVGDFYQSFKHLRDTPHTHNPLDDARGNAEAMLKIQPSMTLTRGWWDAHTRSRS